MSSCEVHSELVRVSRISFIMPTSVFRLACISGTIFIRLFSFSWLTTVTCFLNWRKRIDHSLLLFCHELHFSLSLSIGLSKCRVILISFLGIRIAFHPISKGVFEGSFNTLKDTCWFLWWNSHGRFHFLYN